MLPCTVVTMLHTDVDPMKKVAASVMEVTRMETPACSSALATRSSGRSPGLDSRLSRLWTITNMSSTPIPSSRKGMMGLY